MYKKILFPISLAKLDAQKKAPSMAFEMAKIYKSKIHVLTIMPFLPAHLSEWYDDIVTAFHDLPERIASRM